MRGVPKRFGTAQDIENSFELVQAGQLDPVEFNAALDAIERRQWLAIPIVGISQDRRTVTTRFANEAIAGEVGNVTITGVQHRADPDSTDGMDGGYAFTDMTLAAPLPAGETSILIPAAAPPLIEIGITAARFTTLKEVAAATAASFGMAKGVATQ